MRDDGKTEVTAAGPLPETFEDSNSSLLRNKEWMCGIALEAAARRCGVKIIVLEEEDGKVREPLVCGTSKKLEAPLKLYLKDQRFQVVLTKDGIELPKDWVLKLKPLATKASMKFGAREHFGVTAHLLDSQLALQAVKLGHGALGFETPPRSESVGPRFVPGARPHHK